MLTEEKNPSEQNNPALYNHAMKACEGLLPQHGKRIF